MAVSSLCALAVGLLATLGTDRLAPSAQPPSRLRPPNPVPCVRDELTSYTGRVTKYTVAKGKTTIVIATDEQTTETVTLAHPDASDASAFYLIGGERFTPEAWARIEATPGTLAKGQRATAWVCTNGRALVDWER